MVSNPHCLNCRNNFVLSLVNGSVPREVLAPVGNMGVNTRGFFAATRFDVARGGKVVFSLTGTATAAWLNGQPVKAGAQFAVEAKAGRNTLVLQLDEKNLPEALRLSSADVSFSSN